VIVNVAPLLKQPMGTHFDYEVRESPIDPRGQNAGLLEASIEDIDSHIRGTHTTPGAYLEGTADAHVGGQCSRCLRPIDTAVHAEFAEQYYATIAVDTGAGLAEPPRDVKLIGSDFRIDLTPLLREELILATPQAPLCSLDCKGLCPICGDDLNDRPHIHEEHVDVRWAKLQELRDRIGSEGA